MRWLPALAVLVLLATPWPQAAHGQSARAPAGYVRIAFVVADQGVPFYDTMRCGALDAARKFRVTLGWQGPASVDFQSELRVFNAVIQRHPQGVVVAPFDPNAFIPPVQQLMRQGVPVVTVDGSLSKPVELQNIRTNNPRAGAQAADALARSIGGSGKIIIVALQPGVNANQERVTGFANEIKARFPQITLLPTLYPGGDQNTASQQVSAALRANPDAKGVYATHSAAANGAANAILSAGKRGKVKLVAYDADPQEVNDLKNGVYDALVVQNPYAEGFNSVRLVARYLRHQVKRSSIRYQAYPTTFIATRANINASWLHKYLYRVTC